MKNKILKVATLLIAAVLLLNVMPFGKITSKAATLTQSQFDAKLSAAQSLYPHGTQKEAWSVNGAVVGWQCHGYARWLSWYVWGVDFANGNGANWTLYKSTSSSTYIDRLVPGDVIRYRTSTSKSYNHTIFITSISGSTIYFTDCNSDFANTVKWNRSILKSTLESYLKVSLYGSEASTYGYIAHYTPNTLQSTSTHTHSYQSAYEEAHPHKYYNKCSCGYSYYTGEYKVIGTCQNCISEAYVSRTQYNKHTYDLYEINTTWELAKAFCEEKGGHLVTITSQEEHDLLNELTSSNNTWIGGYLDADSTWKWVTDEAFEFTSWITGEPNNTNGNEIYIGTYTDGNWNDFANSDSKIVGFVCEYEPVTITFEANGGENPPNQITKHYGETSYLYTTNPTRNGYKFKGWGTESNATQAEYWYGSAFSDNVDTTLYAVWQEEFFGKIYDYDNELYYYSYKVDSINENRGFAEVVLYDENYGDSTGTNEYGYEAVIDSTGKVVSKYSDAGNSTIPSGGFVISAHKSKDNIFVKDYIEVGNYMYFEADTETVYVFSTYDKMQTYITCKNNGHKEEIRNEIAPSYDANGYTGDVCCSVCNELISLGSEIQKLEIKNGDANKDGSINAEDVVLLRKILLGQSQAVDAEIYGDVNADGKITLIDLVKLKKYLAGIEEL